VRISGFSQSIFSAHMVVYLYVGAVARLGLIIAVIALWLVFFCYCEMQFQRFCASPNRELETGI